MKTVHYRFISLAYFKLRIWELDLSNLKKLELVEAFKIKLKAGYLKTAHTEFLNHISTNRAL